MGGGLFVLELRPRSTGVWGLLPDGAHDITLSRSHGRAVSVTLSQGNFYSARLAGQPRKLRFTGAHGKRHTVTILERSTQPTPTTIPKRPPALPTITPTATADPTAAPPVTTPSAATATPTPAAPPRRLPTTSPVPATPP